MSAKANLRQAEEAGKCHTKIVESGHFGAHRLAKVVKVARAGVVLRAAAPRTDRTRDDWKFFLIFQIYFGFQDQSARANVVVCAAPRSGHCSLSLWERVGVRARPPIHPLLMTMKLLNPVVSHAITCMFNARRGVSFHESWNPAAIPPFLAVLTPGIARRAAMHGRD